MGCKTVVDDTVLVWNNLTKQMEVKYEVFLQVVGNKGSIFMEEGPILISDFSELPEAEENLRNRLGRRLSPCS